MPRPPSQILAYEEHGDDLWILMRPAQRHGQEPQHSTWWRKTLNGDELVEVGERPPPQRPATTRIPALDN